ncbi:hypothetical protein [Desulfonema magnum]|uniref:Uncharacterized protein n=1 Tax=Desulfonema magnum TaxID=45655 RepID=A0A975GV48_9BACT|nr:hypothetical protein [Desulfonema magnum]QTA93343.1 Uncharacterized protein dnm_094440 [Desulfonema magnum]
MPWVYDPHAGGVKIPEKTKESTRKRILAYAEKHYAGRYTRLEIRFRKQFCYIDAYMEPHVPDGFPPPGYPETREQYIERVRNTPTHLCRLRHFSEDRWSVAFYTYSKEKYEPTFFHNGSDHGTPEEGFEIGAIYLMAE